MTHEKNAGKVQLIDWRDVRTEVLDGAINGVFLIGYWHALDLWYQARSSVQALLTSRLSTEKYHLIMDTHQLSYDILLFCAHLQVCRYLLT